MSIRLNRKRHLRVHAIPGLPVKDVVNLILYQYLDQRDRQIFRCAWFPQLENTIRSHASLAGFYAKRGDLRMLQWCMQKRVPGARIWAGETAAREGHLHILKWLYPQKCKCPGRVPQKPSLRMADYAAMYGHVHVLEWMDESFQQCGWLDRSIHVILRREHVHVLVYAHQTKVPFTDYVWELLENVMSGPIRDWVLQNPR